MYAITISMKAINPEAFELVKVASQEVVAPSAAEPGCVFFDLLLNEDELELRFYEAYVSRAAFEEHLQAAHTQAWVKRCMTHIDQSTIKMPESQSTSGEERARRVLVFGATGKIGTELVKLLANDPRCAEVIALSRDPSSASSKRLSYMAPKVSVRSSSHDQLLASCAGATDAFIIAPLSDDMRVWHEQVAEVLAQINVEHVVKVSVTGARSPESDPPPGRFPSLHWAGEEALREAGLKTTVIRPTIFMQHFEMGTGLYTQGDERFYLPTGDAGVAFLDCRDIALMGSALLLSPRALPFHQGAYELTGPEAITGQKIAEVLSAVRGSAVEHRDGEEAFVARCAELGQPEWPKAVYAEGREGWFSALSTDVFEAIVGRKPRSFATYADDQSGWFKP